LAQEVVFRFSIRDESDVAAARLHTRELGQRQGLSRSAVEGLVTAVSEITRNAVVHAEGGEVLLCVAHEGGRSGVVAVVRDAGPGIADIEQAMRDGYSTGDGLGLGLPSARRLVSKFELDSRVPEGTTVTLTQWSTEDGDRGAGVP
jgi:serine/threonine-protein kinase RsbT